MANVQQITRDYLLRARSEGVAQVTADAQRLGAATDSLAVKTESVSRSQISAEKALERTAQRMNSAYKTTTQLAQAEATLERARAQGLQGTTAYEAAVAGLANTQQRLTGAANDNNSAFDRLANTITRRLIFAFLIKEAKEAAFAIFNLNAELAKTGDIAGRSGAGNALTQGIAFAAALKGIDQSKFLDDFLKFGQEVDRAKRGVGDLAALFRGAGFMVNDTADAFFKVSELVKAQNREAAKFQVLQEAGLPATREMVRLMEQGADRIRKQGEEARKFTDDQLKKAKELDNKWNELWANFTRYAKQSILDVSGLFDGLNNRLLKFVESLPNNELKRKFFPGLDRPAGPSSESAATLRFTVTPPAAPVEPLQDMKDRLALMQKGLSMLGAMAPVADLLRAKQLELNIANREGANLTGLQVEFLQKKLREDELGITALKQQTDASRIDVAIIGLSIEKATELRAIKTLEAQDLINGRTLTAQETQARREAAKAAGEQAQALERVRVNAQIKFDRQTAFLSPSDVQIARELKGLYGDDIPAALNSAEAAAMRANNQLAYTKDILGEITKGLVSGLMSGQSFEKVLKNLSARLADKALEQLLSGEWEKALISAAAAAITFIGSLITSNAAAERAVKLHEQIVAYQEAAARYNIDAALALNDNSTLSGALAEKDLRTQLERYEVLKNGSVALAEFDRKIANERLAIINRFAKEAVEEEKRRADAILDQQRSLDDRLFAATNDTNTEAGKIAALTRQYERERLELIDDGGVSALRLQEIFEAERFNITKAANDNIIEETRRAEEERLEALNAGAKNVVEFLQGLQSGPSATVSPLANYANSRQFFEANNALAMGGNIDATNKWASLADNFLKASRAVNASSQAFQDDMNYIINRGLALPAVQQTTDPVVQAIRDSIAAIQATTAAVDVMRLALSTAITSANPQNIASALSTYFNQLNTTADAGLTFSELVAGVNGLSRDTTTAGLLTQAQIDNLGLARNATVGQLLTQEQLDALGLSRDATVSALDTGSLLRIFQELDNNGNGLLERSELIRAAAQGTRDNTALLDASNSLLDNINRLEGFQHGHVQAIDNFSSRIIQALNGIGQRLVDVGNTHTALFQHMTGLQDAIRQNTGTNSGSQHSGSLWSWLGFERGGWITGGIPGRDSVPVMGAPYEYMVQESATRALVARYGSGVMDTINSGRLPFNDNIRALPPHVIPFPSPSYAGGDNAEIRALRQEVAELRKDLKEALGRNGPIAQTTAAGAVHVREGVDAVQRDTGEMKRAANMRP